MNDLNQFQTQPEVLEYYRNPTKAEIKFGHGALHYRDFEFEKCFDENGNLKLKIRALDDGLIYYYASMEYSTSRNSVTYTILCE